jgi:hypothetical protein
LKAALPWFMSEPAFHPITTVQILPITFEPFDGRGDRFVAGKLFAFNLSGWQIPTARRDWLVFGQQLTDSATAIMQWVRALLGQ